LDKRDSNIKEYSGKIYFEFAIPRMGKRVDNIVIVNDVAFIIEFKVGDGIDHTRPSKFYDNT